MVEHTARNSGHGDCDMDAPDEEDKEGEHNYIILQRINI